jgi:hypothetical protein
MEKTPALQKEHPAFETIKFLYFFFFWDIFVCLDPEPENRMNPDPTWTLNSDTVLALTYGLTKKLQLALLVSTRKKYVSDPDAWIHVNFGRLCPDPNRGEQKYHKNSKEKIFNVFKFWMFSFEG